MIRKLALLIIILLMAVPSIAREQSLKDTLIIATRSDLEPFSFLNVEGKPAGIFVDIWRLWAQKTGKQVQFISSDLETSLENLRNRKADIHSGLLYSPERFEWMSGSQLLYEVDVSLFYRLKQGKISDINQFSGQTIAALRRSRPEQFLKKEYPGILILLCDTTEELVRVSREGKAKGFVIVSPAGARAIDRMGLSGEFEMYGKTLSREKFHAAVLKENTELLALVDKGFNAMSYRELAEIEARWIDGPAKRYYKTSNIIQLTPQEAAWLKEHRTIRLGLSPVMPPLKFFEEGVIKGIEPDYAKLLSEYTGINFQLVACDFKDIDAKAKSGEIDMFLSVYVPERFAYMTLTQPFLEFEQVIVARSDAPFMSGLSGLEGKKIAVVKGLQLHEKILRPYSGIEIVRVDTMEQMFEAVSEGKADALISKVYFASYVMHKYPNLKIAGIADLPLDPYYYAVRKDYPELVGILNKAIKSIPKDRVDAIVQKWFTAKVEYRPNWPEILKWVFVTGGVFALILGLSLLWNRRLAREIVGHKQTLDALRESEDKFKYVFEHSIIGKSITLPSGEMHVNGALCEMLGYTQEELSSLKWQDITYPEDIELTQRAVDSLLSGERDSARFVKRFIHKNGSVVWTDIGSSLRRDKDGKPLYLMTTVSDITERKSAEDEIRRLNAELEQRVHDRTVRLEATNKELEAFAHSVSHDLRAPLRGIDGWSLALFEDYGEKLDGQARQYVSRLRGEAQRMGGLIDDMLKLSRITSAEMQPTPTDLTAMAGSIASRLREERPGRTVEFIIQPGLKADGDARLLDIALTNLFDNAIKFTGTRSDARIEFGEAKANGSRTFFVRDNGVGFDMTYAQKLFGAFQRLHKSSEFPGTGIGLATVQRIIHRHGGRIWAETEADKGATFYFTLPAS